MLPQETLRYLIDFLTGSEGVSQYVGYTDDRSSGAYRVVIVPSGFFSEGNYGSEASEPRLPLPTVCGVPLLFGSDRVEREVGTLVVYADVIASAYYMLSRYEETLHPEDRRDAHGRYTGRGSLAFRGGFIGRPIVDEYGRLLRGWLRECGIDVPEPAKRIAKVYLTHDVDSIARYRHLRGFAGGCLRSLSGREGAQAREVFASLRDIHADPIYTFGFFREEDAKVPSAEKIYFIKAGSGKGHDYPQYRLDGKDFATLLRDIGQDGDTAIGLHASYEAGADPSLITKEKDTLAKAIGVEVRYNRYHFLRTLQPADFRRLIESGITDDFTMAYPDVAGFRLGTCRAVRWIDPESKRLTPLVLHPLTAMDCTLSDSRYMGLPQQEAYGCVTRLIESAKEYGGEVSLLWHNSTVVRCQSDSSFCHRQLYSDLINVLIEECQPKEY